MRHVLAGNVRIMDFPSKPLGDAKQGVKGCDMKFINVTLIVSFRER